MSFRSFFFLFSLRSIVLLTLLSTNVQKRLKKKNKPPKKERLFVSAWASGCSAVMPWPASMCPADPSFSLAPRFGCCRLPGSLGTHLREDPEVHLLFIMACLSVFTAPVTMAGVLDASATGYINAERSFLVSSRRRLFYHHCNASQ